MDIIESKNTINILRKTLNLMDNRLMNHGERVGYILYKMLTCENKYREEELRLLALVGLLHDIGAFREEEIKDMLQLESNRNHQHSIYGYLFMKYLSPLSQYAEIVLYHHVDYQYIKEDLNCYSEIGNFLKLADRVDIILSYYEEKELLNLLHDRSEQKYSEKGIQLFVQAENEYKVTEHLKDNSYIDELNHVLEGIKLTAEEKNQYLNMLAYSIDFRSEYTVMHTITTVGIANELGRLMELSFRDKVNLHYGALLHDIGKISTPLDILEAPGKLTADEMAVMRKHVEVTYNILKGYINDEIVEIAARHHEKLDGSGYFRHLKKEDLTLPQRILGVADIVSALYGIRSYKKAYDKDTIIRIITNEAAERKICPDTVGCMVANYDEIIRNVEENSRNSLQIYSDMKIKFNGYYNTFENWEKWKAYYK